MAITSALETGAVAGAALIAPRPEMRRLKFALIVTMEAAPLPQANGSRRLFMAAALVTGDSGRVSCWPF